MVRMIQAGIAANEQVLRQAQLRSDRELAERLSDSGTNPIPVVEGFAPSDQREYRSDGEAHVSGDPTPLRIVADPRSDRNRVLLRAPVGVGAKREPAAGLQGRDNVEHGA